MSDRIRPELTALVRNELSLPARLAFADGLLTERSVLDYGCGRGGDVTRLAEAGIAVRGWDPLFRPEPAPESADVVLCSYVLNVIADSRQRAETLRRAFRLACRTLVVAVRGTHESRDLQGACHADGVLTVRGTFHHLFAPAELTEFLFEELGTRAISVQPGIAYVFRDPVDRAAYLSRRYGGVVRPDTEGEVLARLVRFLEDYGRAPVVDENPSLCRDAVAAYGRLGRAIDAAVGLTSPEVLARADKARRLDLLVVLGLELFHGEVRMRELPPDRIADVRRWYGSLREATAGAARMLRAVGDMSAIRTAVRTSRVGKTSPSALYVHVDAELQLPALLRLYAACGAILTGRPSETTLLKLHHDRAAVSFLVYPEFDRDPHPRLGYSLSIDLARLRGNWDDYGDVPNRPLLHRKEEFLDKSDPRWNRFARLTRSEVRAGLYLEPLRIGREDGWAEVLHERGVSLRGHRLVRLSAGPH